MPELDLTLLFWLVVLLLILYPQLRHRMVQGARLSLIRRIEEKTGSRVIAMIHRQERVSFLGIPFYRYIDIEDSEQVLRAIRLTPPNLPITLILHTPGGLVLAAAQIAMALRDHPAKKVVVVPHYAMSGGTLVALAADEIWMDPHAVLGPIDPQLADARGGSVPAVSVLRAVEQKGRERASDAMLVRADIAEKAIKQMKEFIIELTAQKYGQERAERLAEELVSGKYTHDYPITASKLRELGVEVRVGIPPEVYQLMDLYPQPAQARPSVEYIPAPYLPPRGRRER
ncbi:MAG: hypothetical protein C4339_01220 [Nitrososphaerota archaeon]